MGSSKTIFSLLLFLFIAYNSFAQRTNNRIQLTTVFETIESQFDVIFSYKDTRVQNSTLIFNKENTLEGALLQLTKKTLFTYQKVGNNSIAVSISPNLITTCGNVTMGTSLSPLSNSKVVTPYEEITCSAEGFFTVQVKTSNDKIKITQAGFQDAQYLASQLIKKPCLTIPLQLEIVELNPITLTNYLAKGIFKEPDGAVTVRYQDFETLPGLIETDVLQTIKALPGVQSVNESVSDINIRGGTNDQNLFLWDGIKMYQSGHFFGLISAFNPQLTKEVTVIKNGSSAAFGDGVSGIINMLGNNELSDSLKISAALNLISADAYIDAPISEKLTVQISGRKSINTIIETPTYNAYFDKAFQNTELTTANEVTSADDTDFSFFDTNLRVLYQASDNDFFRFNFLIFGNDLQFKETATIEGLTLSRQSNLNQNNLSGGIYYNRTWSSRLDTEVQLYGTSYELTATNFDILNDQRLIQENSIGESGIKANLNYSFTNTFNGIFGFQFNETGITNFEDINFPFFQRTDTQVLQTNSIFTEFAYQPTSGNTSVRLGGRLNHISKFDKILFEPRLTLYQSFLKYFSFELLGEIKHQTTSQIIDFQNDFLGVENRRWILSKPNEIPIINGHQISAGFTYKRKGWLINLEGYLKHVTGITTQSQGFQNQFKDIKTHGNYTVRGLELLLNKRFKKTNTWLSYAYAKNTYDFDTLEPQVFHNNLDIRHTLTYGINYSLERFKFSGGFNWHSGKPTTFAQPNNEVTNGEINFQSPNSNTISDYYRLDVSTMYYFKLGNKVNGIAGISIWNLLNNDNITNHFYGFNENNSLEEISEKALKFTPNASLRFIF
ncbi:MAG: TonB-dependent receptor plug domain-containing protein [Patiriisocius sp.]|uniref:TonB-dependent receptor plug domain-containing protein n=1 Tax=Patiriisocius sp. TaxID=2822396 RepID=UPI003EF45860